MGECVDHGQKGNRKGYGFSWYRGRSHKAHRVAWMRRNGPIKEGMQVLHRCDNPRCINPAHLFLGSHGDNMSDRNNKGRAGVKLNPWSACAAMARLLMRDEPKQRQVASELGVGQSEISRLWSGLQWAWLFGPQEVETSSTA